MKKEINEKNRLKLPFRKNCEGYFICDNGKIVARDTGKGYIEFPGGGVDKNEDPKKAFIREAREEAGVIIDGKLKQIGKINFIWGPNWAKTKKQRGRYEKYKGEEMYFFSGRVKELICPEGDDCEPGWDNDVEMKIQDILNVIKKGKPFDMEIKEYREFQLKNLEKLKRKKDIFTNK